MNYPTMHRDEVPTPRELKVCERCAALFTKTGEVHFCQACQERCPWLVAKEEKRGMDYALRWWAREMRGRIQ